MRLAVRAYQKGRPVAPHWAEWCECIARGLVSQRPPAGLPDVFVSDSQVITSVAQRTMNCRVWVTNSSPRARTVDMAAALSSWNRAPWKYPTMPANGHDPRRNHDRSGARPSGVGGGAAELLVAERPLPSGVPCATALSQLALREKQETLCSATTRFGFRESRQAGPYYELNGVRINFRGDNLQVANYDRIDFGGKGDAIDTLPGFLPPSAKNPGWPAAVNNFLRLNYNVQRQHMGDWTPYMMDVCDEWG